MITLRKYELSEIEKILGSRGKQAVERKLNGYEVEFYTEGRGKQLIFTITSINNPFKLYCITELGFDPHTDFIKVRDFYYCFLNDNEFMSMPDEVKERRMKAMGHTISRQTIANYERKLEQKGFIHQKDDDCYYYFTYKGTQIMTTDTEYKKAWAEAFDLLENQDANWSLAISEMIINYGGVARKQAKWGVNAFYTDVIEHINYLVIDSIS